MAIELTRNQVLDLMKDLEPSHWLQKSLLVELNNLSSNSAVKASESFCSPKVLGRFDELASEMSIETAIEASDIDQTQCKWQTYGYRCTNSSNADFCEEHRLVCREAGCDNMADHGCPCEMQFVCGAALCSSHSSCSDHYRR